ncbi:MAG: DUF3168 domain-containing protein [Candidatus Omnitrophota bacterium]|jgi:hypothetical protein
MMQSDVYKTLSESDGVIDLVSTRIYPIELPRGAAVPAIVYSFSDITPVKSLDGESGLDAGIVEITCWAKSYMTAHLIAEAVRAAFKESGLGVMTDTLQDTRDEETHNYGVVINMNAWSEPNLGGGSSTIASYTAQKAFVGDGTTKEFALPKFRSGSLLVFFNGRLAKKGTESDPTAAYWEKSTCDGFVFRVAPKGGDYADEVLAFYEKA